MAVALAPLNIDHLREVGYELVASMTLFCAQIDGSREDFIADGGDLEVISVIERAYGVGVHGSTEL